MHNLNYIVEKLRQNQVIAYPTEAIFGLGCNPWSEQAVRTLLALKQRPQEKGLIILASDISFLRPFIDENQLTEREWRILNTPLDQPTTWVVPANPTVPDFVRGKFDTIAVRICPLAAVKALCEAAGFALISTSANLSGQTPCRTATEVYQQFGYDFPVLEEKTGGGQNPSAIRDIFSGHLFREG